MKKKLILSGLCMVCMLLCGCSLTAKAPVDCSTLLTSVLASQSFSDELAPLSASIAGKYLAIDMTQVKDFAMSIDASRVTAEQIVFLTADNAQSAELLKASLKEYRDLVLDQYRNYQPDEVPKLEKAVLQQNGSQVALIISPDAASAAAALEKAWK